MLISKGYKQLSLLTSRKIAAKRPFVSISEEVIAAIQSHQPVVALESTIISHGMPYPRNLEVAREVEEVVRRNGAVPATVAVINGIPKVGISASDLEILANPIHGKVLKASRRDLGYACAMGRNAGTTVSGTMILAHAAGIPIFATGGIGGVHRGAEVTMDISADLLELSRTPVTVVCAGVKSILDIEKTLEVLETNGVPVLGYGCEIFPAFFTNNSGIKSPLVINGGADQVASVMQRMSALQLQTGMIVGVPNPNAADTEIIQQAIESALRRADREGIRGAAVTPFVLAEVERLTSGASLTANIALIKNNAKVAAEIAVSYAKLRLKGNDLLVSNASVSTFPATSVVTSAASRTPTSTSTNSSYQSKDQPDVLVFGGAIVDQIASPGNRQIRLIRGSSNPGIMKSSYGGVGRNISEALARAGAKVSLVSAVGDDGAGHSLLRHAESHGVDVSRVMIVGSSSPSATGSPNKTSTSTATYTAVHDGDGELVVAVADVAVIDHLDKRAISSLAGALRRSRLAVIDGNLSADAFTAAVTLCESYGVPVFFEPTSDYKCVLPVVTRTIGQIDVIKPNISELCAIISAALDMDLIMQGRAVVVNALGQHRSKRRTTEQQQQQQQQQQGTAAVTTTTSTGPSLNTFQPSSPTHLSSSTSHEDKIIMDIVDVRILATALQQLLTRGGGGRGRTETGRTDNQRSSSTKKSPYTSEGLLRSVVGKHVLVSLGSRGVLWVGPKEQIRSSKRIIDNGGAVVAGSRSSAGDDDKDEVNYGAIASGITHSSLTVSKDDGEGWESSTGWMHFPAIPIDTASRTFKLSHTNGCGDSLCAGVISGMLRELKLLEDRSIHSGSSSSTGNSNYSGMITSNRLQSNDPRAVAAATTVEASGGTTTAAGEGGGEGGLNARSISRGLRFAWHKLKTNATSS